MLALVDNSNSSLNEHLLAEDESSAAEPQTLLASSAVEPERPDESSFTTTRMVTTTNVNSNGNGNGSEPRNSHHRSDPVVIRRPTARLTQARTFWEEHCVYLPAMLGWFLFSALLSSYNKYIFGQSHYHFPCPLLMTSIHFLAQWGFSHAVSELAPEFFGAPRIRAMTWREWAATSVPCGTVTSGDVGLSNLSLVRISITFYTMVKASTPIFVLVWAYFLGIEKITVALVVVVLVIAAGEFLTVAGEGGDLDVVGLILCLAASVLSGARWTLVQLKLRTMDPPLKTTIATMRLLSPSMFASLFVISLAVEQPWKRLAGDDALELVTVLGLGLLGAFFAISMVLCEFWLIMQSNAIVLMIGGVLKEMVTIMVGVRYFDDKLNKINVSGCVIVFLGVVIYKVTHYMEAQQEKLQASYVTTPTEIDEDDIDDGVMVVMADDSETTELANGGGGSSSISKNGSGCDAADDRYKEESDGLLRAAGSGGIELRKKQEVARVHPPSPANSNGDLQAKSTRTNSTSDKEIV